MVRSQTCTTTVSMKRRLGWSMRWMVKSTAPSLAYVLRMKDNGTCENCDKKSSLGRDSSSCGLLRIRTRP